MVGFQEVKIYKNYIIGKFSLADLLISYKISTQKNSVNYNEIMFLQDFLFPKFCLGCNLPGTYICPYCQKHYVYADENRCFYCNKSSYFNLTHPNCLKYLYIDGVTSIFYYNHILKKILKNIKYRLSINVLEEFLQTIDPSKLKKISFYNSLSDNFYLQPIPLSTNKLKSRGFNQAFLFARFFKRFLGYPVSNWLVKIKETRPQAELKAKKDRYQNVRSSFIIDPSAPKKYYLGSQVILVDDVVTTGSTVKEATRVLKRSGVSKVFVLTVAKG